MLAPEIPDRREPLLGGHVLAAVLVAASALCVLWLVAGPLAAEVRVDAAVLGAVVHTRPSWLVISAVALSTVAVPAVPVAITAVGAAWVAWRHRTIEPILLALVGLGTLALGDVGLKDLVARPRPPLEWWAMPAHGASFPSGHAVFSAGALLLIIALVVRAGMRPPRAVGVAGAALALAVGLARLVVGVHYPSDVLAGWAVAVVAVGIAVLVVDRSRSWVLMERTSRGS